MDQLPKLSIDSFGNINRESNEGESQFIYKAVVVNSSGEITHNIYVELHIHYIKESGHRNYFQSIIDHNIYRLPEGRYINIHRVRVSRINATSVKAGKSGYCKIFLAYCIQDIYNEYKIPYFTIESTGGAYSLDDEGNEIVGTSGKPACYCYIRAFMEAFGRNNIKIQIASDRKDMDPRNNWMYAAKEVLASELPAVEFNTNIFDTDIADITFMRKVVRKVQDINNKIKIDPDEYCKYVDHSKASLLVDSEGVIENSSNEIFMCVYDIGEKLYIESLKREAAMKVQAAQRGRVVRQQQKKKVEAAMKVQATQRGRVVRQQQKKKVEAAQQGEMRKRRSVGGGRSSTKRRLSRKRRLSKKKRYSKKRRSSKKRNKKQTKRR